MIWLRPFMNSKILEEGRISAAKFALGGNINNVSIYDIALEMLKISSDGLKRRNKLDGRGIDERQFLDPLFNIVNNKKTGAEILLVPLLTFFGLLGSLKRRIGTSLFMILPPIGIFSAIIILKYIDYHL